MIFELTTEIKRKKELSQLKESLSSKKILLKLLQLKSVREEGEEE